MFTTTINPQLVKMHTATAEQLAKFIAMKADRGPRFLHAEMKEGILVMYWTTKTGFFVECHFDKRGDRIKRTFFRGWNEDNKTPFNPVFQ